MSILMNILYWTMACYSVFVVVIVVKQVVLGSPLYMKEKRAFRLILGFWALALVVFSVLMWLGKIR